MTRNRGQTTQDYILGVSIMLATAMFVVGFTPGVFQSYESAVDGIDRAQADRAAEYLVTEYSVPGEQNVLRHNTSGGIHDDLDDDFGAFREGAGLDTRTQREAKPNVNVVVVNATEYNGDDSLTPIEFPGRSAYEFGDDYGDQPAATKTRVVKLDDDPGGECTPACWLVVRVW